MLNVSGLNIDFETLKALAIPEGNVTQIADASGRVLWAVSGGKVILEVEKITSNTYAGETTYTEEEFILFDIYPKTNGTVTVTYGGLSKTITDMSGAEEPNAQKVFFGTFNGVSDSVETPASGELVIKGDCAGFGCSSYASSSKNTVPSHCNCVKEIVSFGDVEYIPEYAFSSITGSKITMETIEIPKTVTKIGGNSFAGAKKLQNIIIGEGVTHIERGAFYQCPELKTVLMRCPTPPTLDKDATGKYNNFGVSGETTAFVLEEIVVPKGCVEAYKTASSWATYAPYVVEES